MTSATPPLLTRRAELLARLARGDHYDIAIVGGGATGLGVALDAAARGFSVVLVESHDFAKGTSSRATKLVHGGVRYLAQGHVSLVHEALHERRALLANAPHLAQPLAFVVPTYQWWEMPFYGLGLRVYDALAGQAGLGRTELLTREQTLGLLPTLRPQGLHGGVRYWDGQFDDARLALALARSAALRGALLLNYCRATELLYQGESLAGLVCEDTRTGRLHHVHARCVINAAGVWVDELRQKDAVRRGPAGHSLPAALVAPSQGIHLVVDSEFLAAKVGLMVPRTADGRVLFAVPWLGKVILGTTDTPRHDLPREPLAFKEEIDFILNESGRYLRRAPVRADVRSIWVGLRPLVKPQGESAEQTKGLSREHTVLVSHSGLVTVTGGKWTTYRAMAEDVLDACAARHLIDARPAGQTLRLTLVGGEEGPGAHGLGRPPGLHCYGSEQARVASLPGSDTFLCPGLTEAMVRFAARYEYALTVEDMLARRSRLLFLDARLAARLAQPVGELLLQETGLDPEIAAFSELTQHYLHLPE